MFCSIATATSCWSALAWLVAIAAVTGLLAATGLADNATKVETITGRYRCDDGMAARPAISVAAHGQANVDT